MTRIVAVCTGNVCRSPAVERLLRARLRGAPDLTVVSFGTRALVGSGVDPTMAELIRAAGADPEGFSARSLAADELRRADLVLALSREHRAAVVRVEPSAVRRTFLLRELAAIAEQVHAAGWPEDVPDGAAERLAALPRLAAGPRSRLAGRQDMDVVDPFKKSPQVYALAMDQIVGAVDRLVAALR